MIGSGRGQTAPVQRRRRVGRVLGAIACGGSVVGLVAACGLAGPAGSADPPVPERAAAHAGAAAATAPEPPVLDRAAIDTMSFPPLEFEPPEPERFSLSNGIEVYYMEDRSLPLVELYALRRGGSSFFERSELPVAEAVSGSLLLSGGTRSLEPDSVDWLIEYHALAPSFSSSGSAMLVGMETPTRHLDLALRLWVEVLRYPRFDPERVESWRLRQLELVRRGEDQPGSVAVSTFNRVLFGDHPIGWNLTPEDLAPGVLTGERLRRLHEAITCADNMTLGVVGDISRADAAAKLEAAFGDMPACAQPLVPPDPPVIRDEAGVFIVHKAVNQTSLVMGQPGGILQRDDPEYYAAQIANWILGGSGLSSRVSKRVRTDEGLAYGASTVWGAGIRHERAFGALTQTRADATVATALVIRDVLEQALREPPTEEEVRLAIDNTVNAFVFAFQTPGAIVTRQMSYRVGGLPADWLQRYVAGIQEVTPRAVHDVVRRYIRPQDWTIIIVGDTTKFDAAPETLGPVVQR